MFDECSWKTRAFGLKKLSGCRGIPKIKVNFLSEEGIFAKAATALPLLARLALADPHAVAAALDARDDRGATPRALLGAAAWGADLVLLPSLPAFQEGSF